MKKIPVRTLYLLLVIGIGLVGLGIGSTYAIFTTSAEISNPISLGSNLSYDGDVMETVEVKVPAGEMVTTTLNVTNSSGTTLNYTAWYLDDGQNMSIGTSSGTPTGSLATGAITSVVVELFNYSEEDVSVVLGISSSSDSVVLGDNMNTISSESIITPLSDFTYYLGSEISTITSFDYIDEKGEYGEVGTEYELTSDINLNTDEILLVDYIGTSKNVYVPDTYVVNDVTYNVTLLSDHYFVDGFEHLMVHVGVFQENTNIEIVNFQSNVKFLSSTYNDSILDYSVGYNNASYLFRGCTNLTRSPLLSDNILSMAGTFMDCTNLTYVSDLPSSLKFMYVTFMNCINLVDAPVIPNSVVNMHSTFRGCTSLVDAPAIPESVTQLANTFEYCSNLVNAPVIPSSVTSLFCTFAYCTSLVTAPEIPSSITSMDSTFYGCTELTGIVRINSTNVSKFSSTFYNTVKNITVEVPDGSTTHTKLSESSYPSNVTITPFTAS